MSAPTAEPPVKSGSRERGTEREPSARTLRGLDALNFLLADVQTGVGPFLAIYLAAKGWNPERAGLALTVGGIAGIAVQTPAGALIDRLRAKRALIAIGISCLALGALVIALSPHLWPVLAAQTLIGSTSSIFLPAICAVSLGIVGHNAFDRRQGRNQTFNAAGNVFAAASMGAIAYLLSDRAIFFFVAAMAVPTLLCLRLINPKEIDHDLARNCDTSGKTDVNPSSAFSLLKDRPLLIFLCCAVLLHFANAAMLPLLGEVVSKGKGRASMLFMSACVIVTQLTITCISSFVGRLSGTLGRKPLLLIAFAALPLRGVLYTLTRNAALLISIQLLDGVVAGIFGVVSALVISDLTRGTGRFNLAQGAIATAVGIGASVSQFTAGAIAHHAGFPAAFLFLSAIAAAAFVLLLFAMPETLPSKRQQKA